MKDLTLKQNQFFEALKENYGKDALPSLSAIKELLGYKSKNSVAQYFNVLKKKNIIEEKNSRYYISQDFLGARLFSSKVRAGFASAMEDEVENLISFDRELELNKTNVFIFRVSGDSMVDLGIFEGDYVSIKKNSYAQDKDIVLANIDGGFTLKTYRNKNNKVWLEPANKNYPNLYPRSSLVIFGVALGIMRKF